MLNSPIAAVDLGSNSFRLQIAQVVNGRLYPVDSLKQIVRLGADIGEDNALSDASMKRALDALMRFGERLRGFDPKSVRAVGTNSFRVSSNGAEFLKKAEAALGFSIDVIAGREEARLIYLGAAHSLPNSQEKRLVVDIGGGSTEFIIGSQYKALEMDSLVMGCVSYSQRYFPNGSITKAAFHEAEFAAKDKVQTIAQTFHQQYWSKAVGTSGTGRALFDILMLNHYASAGITLEGMYQLRTALIKAGRLDKLSLNGLRSDRLPVLAGGLAIMIAIFEELNIPSMDTTLGALRDGLLFDLIGRVEHTDLRESTIQSCMQRYHIDKQQAQLVRLLARQFFDQLVSCNADQYQEACYLLEWAANLHEIGRSIAYSAYHRHSAYMLQYADMPGFTKQEQMQLSIAVLAHRGSLKKLQFVSQDQRNTPLLLALRLATIFYRSRRDIDLPAINIQAESEHAYTLAVPDSWLLAHPLTAYALENEVKQWQSINIVFRVEKIFTKN